MSDFNTQNYKETAEHECAVCSSSDNIVEHSFTEIHNDTSAVELCMEHKRLFEILGQPDPPNPTWDVNEETQQTQKVTIRIPKPLIEATDTTAEAQGQTRSELVRDAITVYVEIQEINSAADDLLTQAIEQSDKQTNSSRENTEFLKQRIRKLESLLEDSIEKI